MLYAHFACMCKTHGASSSPGDINQCRHAADFPGHGENLIRAGRSHECTRTQVFPFDDVAHVPYMSASRTVATVFDCASVQGGGKQLLRL